ncbi:MAG: hypothetical protein ACRDWX_07780 [Acidimicrobiia bacterium]
MRTLVLALLVVALAVVGPVAVAVWLVVPRLLDPIVMAAAVEEAGVAELLRQRAAQRVAEEVREATGVPVTATPMLEGIMAEVLDDQWVAAATVSVVIAARGGGADSVAVLELAGPKERLAARWPEVLRALYLSLPLCGAEALPEPGRPPTCRPEGLSPEVALASLPVPGPEVVLADVPDRQEVRPLRWEAAGWAGSVSRQNRLLVAGAALAALLALPLVAPRATRLIWLGRGLVAPSLILAGAGVALLGVAALAEEGVADTTARLAAHLYTPTLLGSIVVLLVGGGLAFAGGPPARRPRSALVR